MLRGYFENLIFKFSAELYGVSAFDATSFATHRALAEPQQGFLDVSQSQSVFPASELGLLESFETADDHNQEVFVSASVHATFLDGTFLKVDVHEAFIVILPDNLESVRRVVLEVLFFKNLRVLCSEQIVLGLHEFNGSRLVLDDFVSLFKDVRLARIELSVDSLDDDIALAYVVISFKRLDEEFFASAHDVGEGFRNISAEFLDFIKIEAVELHTFDDDRFLSCKHCHYPSSC